MKEEKMFDFEYIEKYLREMKRDNELFLTNGELILNKIYKDLLKHEVLDFEDLHLHSEDYSVSKKELELISNALSRYCERKYLSSDDRVSFPNESIFIKQKDSHLIEYFQMSGQGVYSSFKLHDISEVNLEKVNVMEYSDFLDRFRRAISET